MEKDWLGNAAENVLSRFIRSNGIEWFGHCLEYSLFGILCYIAGGGSFETFMDKALAVGILIVSFALAVWRETKERKDLMRLARYIAELENESRDRAPAP